MAAAAARAGEPTAGPPNRTRPAPAECAYRPLDRVVIATAALAAWLAMLAALYFESAAVRGVIVIAAAGITVLLLALVPLCEKWMPQQVSGRFAAHVAHQSALSGTPVPIEHQALTAMARHSVGMRRVRGDGRPERRRPHATLFYPTDVDDRTSAPQPFLPNDNDFNYALGTMRYQGAPAFFSAHLPRCRISAVLDAPPASTIRLSAEEPSRNGDNEPCKIGSKEHPVVIFSHGLAGHQHQYFSFIADLVAGGAIVLALEHTDGTAAFSVKPPNAPRCAHGDGVGIPYVPCPPNVSEAVYRFEQLYKLRIPETQAAIDFVRTGGIHAMLLGGDAAPRDAVLRHMMAVTNRPPPVSLVGHSFGGATAAATALRLAESELADRVASVVVYDMWRVPTEGLPLVARAIKQRGGRTPPLLMVDSEEWHRDAHSRARNVELRHAWGPHSMRVWTQGTDHLSLTEAALHFRAPFVRKWFRYQDDRVQMALWASQALEHIRCATPLIVNPRPPAPAPTAAL